MKWNFLKDKDWWAVAFVFFLLFLLFSTPAILDYYSEEKDKLVSDSIDSRTSKTVICQDGYKYLIVKSGFGTGLTQMFENGPDGIRAAECPTPTKGL